MRALLHIDFQVHIDLGAVIELADSFRVALSPLVLGIDFVIDGAGKRWKAVAAVRSDNVGLDRASAGVGHINDGIRKGIILTIKHLPKEQAPGALVFLIGRGIGKKAADNDKQTADGGGRDH